MPPVPRPLMLPPASAAQRVVDVFHLWDQLGLGIGARIGGEQALLIGEQHQQIRLRQVGGTSADRLSLSPTLISSVATASFSLMIGYDAMRPAGLAGCRAR
jgi:hypothetical protein